MARSTSLSPSWIQAGGVGGEGDGGGGDGAGGVSSSGGVSGSDGGVSGSDGGGSGSGGGSVTGIDGLDPTGGADGGAGAPNGPHHGPVQTASAGSTLGAHAGSTVAPVGIREASPSS